jgi:glucokinase
MAADDNGPLVAGVDLGGTKILAGIVDARNRVLGRAKVATPAEEGNTAILYALVEAVTRAAEEAGVVLPELAGLGVGSPGPLDAERGVIPFSANLNVRDFALASDLSSAVGRPVLLRNDVRVGGYGEYHLGAGRGHHSMLAAFVGTGIGGCIILDGKVVEGVTGNAGEVGHLVLKRGGPTCGCGRKGCMEALASRSAIARRIAKAAKKGHHTSLAPKLGIKQDRLKSKDLAAAYTAGDPVTVREVGRAAEYLGLGLGGLINVLGPEIVVLGGGVTEALGAPYVDLVRASARARILADPDHQIRIEPAALGDDAGLLGAALMARERFG